MADPVAPLDPLAGVRHLLARPPAGTCEARLAQLESDNERLRSDNERLQAENRHLRQLQSKTMAATRNTNFGSAKHTAIALAFELANQQSAAPERTEYAVCAARLAEQTGLSEHTVALHTKEQLPKVLNPATGEIVTLYERRVRHVRTTDPATGAVGEVRSQTTYVPTMDPLAMLDVLAIAAPLSGKRKNGHGGTRFACPDHPNANVVKRTIYECAVCRRQLGEDPPVKLAADEVMVSEQDAHSEVRPGRDHVISESDVMVNEQVAHSVAATRSSDDAEHHPTVVDVYRVSKTSTHHNDEFAQASIAATWLQGAPVVDAPPPRTLDAVRPTLAAADHARDRAERHRTNGHLGASLVELARSRGRLPVPKPPPPPEPRADAFQEADACGRDFRHSTTNTVSREVFPENASARVRQENASADDDERGSPDPWFGGDANGAAGDDAWTR